jgi:hypothetical protein
LGHENTKKLTSKVAYLWQFGLREITEAFTRQENLKINDLGWKCVVIMTAWLYPT